MKNDKQMTETDKIFSIYLLYAILLGLIAKIQSICVQLTQIGHKNEEETVSQANNRKEKSPKSDAGDLSDSNVRCDPISRKNALKGEWKTQCACRDLRIHLW